jgi:Xaa-Pro aminopeptidase
MKEQRFRVLLDVLRRMDLDACIIKGMDNIFYLSGFRGSEGSLLVTQGDVLLLTDARYTTHAREVACEGVTVTEITPRNNILKTLCERYGVRRLGFDSFHTTYHVYAKWVEENPGVSLVPLGQEVEDIREQKEPEEIDAIRRAIDVATHAFNAVLERLAPGMTEREVANELDYAMRRLGADAPSFDTIVASGARAALPHANPTDKKLVAGETVIIDFGCSIGGYVSDETCTLSVGTPSERMLEIHSVVRKAQEKGIASVRSGMPVRELDTIVRGFIEECGYGDYFRHGTGHGVGVAVHEAPAISVNTNGLLQENMVITIEPGIYVPHEGGVRLEDMVLVCQDRGEVLTRLRKDLFEV